MNTTSIGNLADLAPMDMYSTFKALKEYSREKQVSSYPGDDLDIGPYDGLISANLKGDKGGEYNLISLTVSAHDALTGLPANAVLTFDEVVDKEELIVGKNISDPGDLSASPMCSKDEEFYLINMKTGTISVIDSRTVLDKVDNWIVA